MLAPLTAQRAGDPEFDYVLGLAALDSGRPAEAIIALQRVVAQRPDYGPARAELARAYALAGDADTAQREFAQLNDDPSIPDPVRDQFSRILGDLDRQVTGRGTDVSSYVEFGAGYDSNVNSATGETSLIIPVFAAFGPAALSPGAIESEDAFAKLDGGVSVVTGLSRQTRGFASLLGALRENESESAFDTAALTGTAGLAHTLASRGVVTGSASYSNFWLGGDTYRRTGGLALQYAHPVGDGAVTAGAQYYHLDYDGDPLRDADRYAANVTYSWPAGVVGAQLGTEKSADHLSNDFAGVSAAYEVLILDRASLTFSAGFETRDYDAPDPLFLTARDDDQFDAAISMRLKVRENIYLRPTVSWTDNSSNIALYDYDRFVAALSIRAEF
jgi:tetratricopeptide (TPR) repeat protein